MEQESMGLNMPSELDSEDQPEKPGVLKIVLPFITTGFIFWWLFRGIDFDGLTAAMAVINLPMAILAVAIYTLVFFFAEALSFGKAYKWFLTEEVSWKDIASLVVGKHLIATLFAPLAEVILPTYFLRTWGIRVLHSVSAFGFVIFCDTFCLNLVLTIALLISGSESLGAYWIYFILGSWIFQACMLTYFLTSFIRQRIPFFYNWAINYAYTKAKLKHYLTLYGIRSIIHIAMPVAVGIMLSAMDMHLSIPQLLLFVPVFVISAFLPISVGGYGGPQGAAMLLLVNVWHLTTPEQAIAFSLVWSTLFLITRTVGSAVFAWPMWNLIQQKKDI